MFFKGQTDLMTALSFLALWSTNRLSNRYSYMYGWDLFEGGLLVTCSSRVGVIRKGAMSRMYDISVVAQTDSWFCLIVSEALN